MGSTSSIAAVEAQQEEQAAESSNMSSLKKSSGSNIKKGSSSTDHAPKSSHENPKIHPPTSQAPVPPPPKAPPTPPPIPAHSGQDEVDGPIFDKEKKEKILGKDTTTPSKSSEPERKATIIPMNEADRIEMERIKKGNPKISALLNNIQIFVSTLREDLKLEKDRDFLSNSMDRDLMSGFINCVESERKHLADFLAVIGGAQVTYDSYNAIMTSLEMTFLNDNLLYNIKRQDFMMMIVNLRGIMWNYSDSSMEFCNRFGNTGMFDYLLQDLIGLKSNVANPKALGYTFESCVGILHNTSKFPGNRPKMKAMKFGAHLLPFLKCTDTKVKMVTLLTLSYLLDETQNNLLLADDSVFDFTLSMIQRALKSEDHRYDGFSIQELVEGLTGMAKNDDNKKLLVKKGTVPALVKIMEGTDEDEKHAAVRCMWELSFDKENREAFHKDEELIKLLRNLKNSQNKKISKAASGALWEIHLVDIDNAEASSPEGRRQESGHIMISYQWADQKKLIQVKESLREGGYQVWMDVDNMGGSTLQAMAEAVQNADVVLICMSERYKLSQNCRSEAEYAFSLQKPIVPLLMERNYKPDGWLGMIKGTKLFFDFSGKYEYETKVNDLMKELGSRGKGGAFSVPVDKSQVPVIRAGPVDAGKSPGLASWSSKDIHNWLHKANVKMNDSLGKLTGEQLVFLRKLSHRAPEFYYAYIERKLHLDSIEDMMKFSTALDGI